MDRTTRALLVTIIVIVHLGLNYLHRIAHHELNVWLQDWQRQFAIYVIGLAPLVAMVLAWTALRRIGYMLLTISMFAALVFGAYFHFIADSGDNLRFLPHLEYSQMFIATAILLLLFEALGCWAGIYALVRSGRRPH